MTPHTALPTVIVLAAGRGERFAASGGVVHKLQALIHGQTVLACTVAAVRASGLPLHVVTAPADVGVGVVGVAHFGMGDSIARGVVATANAAGWLILPADLPMILPSTLQTVAQLLMRRECAVAQAMYQGTAAHPVGFTPQCYAQLAALHGDAGARSVVQHYRSLGAWQAVTVDDAGTVQDMDTMADWRRLGAMPTAVVPMVG